MRYLSYNRGHWNLLREIVVSQFKLRDQGSLLGVLWSVLNPLLMLTILYVVFNFHMGGQIENYAVYLLIGLVIYTHFSNSTMAGLDGFRQAKFKHLSSGMKVRLAFSTTRYFDADIYLLDEALSAGDQSFRKKCEQVFVEYREKNRTMLTSSHNMTFIETHCEKTIWVDHGRIMAFDETAEVVARYLAGSGTATGDQE